MELTLLLLVFIWMSCFAKEAKYNQIAEDINLVKFISDNTALVQDIMQLDYLFSFENGGHKEKKYVGKLCTASHPDEFYTKCYQEYNQSYKDLIWLFTDKYHDENMAYSPDEVILCK